jgi:PilZ domain-containing protein
LNQRKHARYLVEYTGSFLGEGITASGIILNLSVAGCRARSERTFGRGELLQVLIDVPRYKTPLQVECAMVRWSRGQEFGMEFLGSPKDDLQQLRELIRETEAASALRGDNKD